MGRAPCCDKANVKKGPWSPEEDAKLKAYIEKYGTGGNWIALPRKIGLKRCGKSCRLRWLNYLRPNIKHGGLAEEEDNISLYISIGDETLQGTLPAISISLPTPNSEDLHPIIEIMRGQELGKFVINIAVPIAIALLLTSNGIYSQKLLVVHTMAFGLMIGCMAIWNGILFRKAFSRLANILEQFGISLVLLFLYGLVASFLPKGFSWACWLCGALCLTPFIYARIKRRA